MKRPQTSIQSKEHEELLDIIDNIRSQGVSGYIDIPQIIVVGDQSSGKSSCLEAICGLRFPVNDSLCTRFATEYILRRSDEVSFRISIVPDSARLQDEKDILSHFRPPTEDLEDFHLVIAEAGKLMGIDTSTKTFSKDVLRIEISGPTQPHLTLVDLPGLFHAASTKQSDQDQEAVTSLVESYMQQSRSIILAVVSAKNDLNNQVITKKVRQIDQKGTRTLGIITKPDMLHAGSDSEKEFYRLAENKEIHFALGWHVVKNRDFDTRDTSNAERDEAERNFFSNGIWDSLPKGQVGVEALRHRLSRVLQNQIVAELPNLILEVDAGIKDCMTRLERLGNSRSTLKEQRSYLHEISEDFSKLVQNAIAGHYDNEYFGDPNTDEGFQKRLRAMTQNHLDNYKEVMVLKGHKWRVVDKLNENLPVKNIPQQILLEDYLKHVAEIMKRSRGCELPGVFRPEIIGDLFRDQSTPWPGLTIEHADEAFTFAKNALSLALQSVADQSTKDGILRHIINPALEQTKQKLDSKVQDTMKQHRTGHPTTFNHYFIDNIQKLRNEHMQKHLGKKLGDYFHGYVSGGDDKMVYNRDFSLKELTDQLAIDTEANMTKFACSEAFHCMSAYYKVALKFVIDDFAIHCIEECLMDKLLTIFTTKTVLDMEDDMIERIASETGESQQERTSSTKKLEILKKALRLMKEYKPTAPLGNDSSVLAMKFERLSTSAEDHDLSDKHSEDTCSSTS